jgi:hypothetical protein
MNGIDGLQRCPNCGATGSGKYCTNCGNSYAIKRITIAGIYHDIFHFFTHLDKGFGYTLKQLVVAPGTMQREYIEGNRSRHQKPFSMFFICASVTALLRYWINLSLLKHYHGANEGESNFFHQYMVLMHTILLPIYALITYLVFYKSKYNYAEVVVFLLYTFGIFFFITDVVAALRLIWPDINTDYIELLTLGFYNTVSCLYFFNTSNKWLVVVKSIVALVLIYFTSNYAEDLVVSLIKHG